MYHFELLTKGIRMKLSVMMITYNHERVIAQALESILAQRVNFEFEIVVGEDCSTDRTRDVLMDFYGRYPGQIIPLIRDRNLGMMRNLEQTLSACRGQYVALIEGDDYWTCSDKLQKQVDFLDTHPDYTICCHRARVLDEGGAQQMLKELGSEDIGVFPSRAAGTYTIEDLLSDNFIMTCSVVYRSGTFGALPSWFLDMGLGDWALFALVARSGPIQLMGDVMAVYRVHSGGVWSSQAPYSRMLKTARMLGTLDEHLRLQYHGTIRCTQARLYLYASMFARKDGNKAEAAKLLFDSLRNGGWNLPEARRTLGPILLGSWHGMSITTQLVQHALGKFGLKLVRADGAPNPSPSTAPPSTYGLENFFTLLKRFNFNPRRILDVGANRGLWTRKAIQFFPDAQYTLIEPQDTLKVYIQDLLDAGHKITWVNAGAGDASGSLPFNLSYRDDSSTFMPVPEGGNAPQITVPVRTLNEIVACSDAPPPDMVKIDAEGFDLKVLTGASDLIGKTEIFFVEVVICSVFYDNTIARVIQWMDDAGYRVIDITDINRSTKYGVLWLCELAFLRKDSHLLDSATTYE
jgi:FkbM family methyltransferase